MSVLDPDRLRAALAALEPGLGAAARSAPIVRAPGRINLIGEHTDYNEGFVLPVAIGLETWIAFVPTDDRRVTITLEVTGETKSFDLDAPLTALGSWIDYVAGMAWSLTELGVPLRGFRGLLAGTLPVSAGLSSSAALELASALALTQDPPTDRPALARAAQRAENEFVGMRCGIMDQFAVACGCAGHALLIDCRSLTHRDVPLALGDHLLVACDTRSPRRLTGSEYNTRRAECEAAVRVIARRDPTVRALRDVTPAALEALAGELDPVALRRCRHVVAENGRVLAAVKALDAGDLQPLGPLLAESHRSLRDLFEVSSPELDALVEIASGVDGVIGSRMTGGGFGGCTVTLVARDALDDLRRAVEREYPRRTGLEAALYVTQAVDGAGMVAEEGTLSSKLEARSSGGQGVSGVR